MRRFGQFFASPQFHLIMSVVWALLLIPTLLFWPNSILWIAAISLYANFIGHWSAYQAARAERSNSGTVGDDTNSP